MILARRTNADTWLYQSASTKSFGGHSYLALDGSSTAKRYALIAFALPPLAGATIQSAKLRVWTTAAWSGSHTLTAKRITTSWRETGPGAATYAKAPALSASSAAGIVNNWAKDQVIEIDVTTLLREAAAGDPFYGLSLELSSVGVRSVHSRQAPLPHYHPELELDFATPPDPPTNLRPGGARVISSQTPVFSWSFTDSDLDLQSAFRVQVDDESTFATPMVSDSGWVTSSAQERQLSAFNRMTANQSSFETDTTGWAGAGNASLARSTAQALHGVASLAVTSLASGNMSITTPTSGANTMGALTAGKTYTAVAYYRPASSTRNVRTRIQWLDSTGTQIGNTSEGADTAEVANAWTKAIVTATAPANTASARVVLTILSTGAANEVHYVDQVMFVEGNEPPAFLLGIGNTGLAEATYFWRVAVRDENGVESAWSDVQEFSRSAKNTVAITQPANNGTVEETTPAIVHTFTGPRTQGAVRYVVEERYANETEWRRVHDSGRRAVASNDFTYTLPDGIIKRTDSTYRVHVFVWDTLARESIPGDPAYASATSTFTFVRSAVPAAVSTLTATLDNTPAITLNWTRTNTPDFWAIRVTSGTESPRYVETRLDPESVRVDATSWRMKLWELNPQLTHTIEVEAVVLDGGIYKHSQGNPTAQATPKPTDAWLIMPDRNLYVALYSDQQQDYAVGEAAQTFYPLDRRDPVRISGALRGFEGTIVGTVRSRDDEATARMIKHYARRNERIILVHGARAFRVALGAFSTVPVPGSDNDWFDVEFEFWQTDNFFVTA